MFDTVTHLHTRLKVFFLYLRPTLSFVSAVPIDQLKDNHRTACSVLAFEGFDKWTGITMSNNYLYPVPTKRYSSMRCTVIILTGLLFHFPSRAQDGVQLLKALHTKNYGQWFHTMTFVQKTEFYRNDSLIRKATWYEALQLPFDLRIDFDDPAKGNFVLYKKDSTYRFQNHTLSSVSAEGNPFIFFIGALYFMPFDSVLHQLAGKGYDVKKSYRTAWEGRATCVIGRNSEKDSANAVWLDIENLWFVRLVETNKRGQKIDAHMKAHKRLAKGSSETKVDIYVNGKLVQVETYDQINIDVPLNDALFDPLKASGAPPWFGN